MNDDRAGRSVHQLEVHASAPRAVRSRDCVGIPAWTPVLGRTNESDIGEARAESVLWREAAHRNVNGMACEEQFRATPGVFELEATAGFLELRKFGGIVDTTGVLRRSGSGRRRRRILCASRVSGDEQEKEWNNLGDFVFHSDPFPRTFLDRRTDSLVFLGGLDGCSRRCSFFVRCSMYSLA